MAEITSEEFEQQVELELEPLSRKQKVEYARRCALRALPYLCAEGHIDFWSQDDRQKHLYAIFAALDGCSAVLYFNARFNKYTFNAALSASDSVFISVSDFTYASYSTYAIADAYSITYSGASAITCTNAFDAISYCIPANQVEKLLLQDLADIKNYVAMNLPIEHAPQIWHNFKQALIDNDCQYWADLYEDIFAKGFAVDLDGLEARQNVPEEIKEQGAAAVGHYLAALNTQGIAKLNESRVLILGDKGAGKTCLARKLKDINAPMTKPEQSTAGVDTSIWPLPDNDMQVRIWDFAGHTVTHAVHQFFLSERCLYILVHNARTDDRSRLYYWLDHMKNYGGDSQAIILVNEHDEHKIQIPENTLKRSYAIHSVHYLNIKTDKIELEQFRQLVSNTITSNPTWNNQVIPNNYYQVKADLEAYFDQDGKCNEHITIDRFEQIAKKHGINEHNQLLGHLNALGIGLWYPKLAEFNTLVLNPEWISHGVYKIINYVANSKGFTIGLDEFGDVFSGDDMYRFNFSLYKFLFKLINHYELAYELVKDRASSNRASNESLIIPHLMPEDEPATLPTFNIENSLMLKYVAEHPLPPHTISRFIVRHNHHIQPQQGKQMAWRKGAILELKAATSSNASNSKQDKTIALVKEDDRTIAISVTGPDKTEFISSLRNTMDDIFNSYKSDKPALLYRVIAFGQLPSHQRQNMSFNDHKSQGTWLNDTTINAHTQNKRKYFDAISEKEIDLNPTAIQYKIENAYFGSIINQTQSLSTTTINNTFNIKDCAINLQSSINELAEELDALSEPQNAKSSEIKALENTAKVLAKAEGCDDAEQLKKSGAVGRVKRVLDDLSDKDSTLRKAVEGSRYGAGIVKDIAKGYNQLADLTGLPQVPKILLGK